MGILTMNELAGLGDVVHPLEGRAWRHLWNLPRIKAGGRDPESERRAAKVRARELAIMKAKKERARLLAVAKLADEHRAVLIQQFLAMKAAKRAVAKRAVARREVAKRAAAKRRVGSPEWRLTVGDPTIRRGTPREVYRREAAERYWEGRPAPEPVAAGPAYWEGRRAARAAAGWWQAEAMPEFGPGGVLPGKVASVVQHLQPIVVMT